MSELLARFCRYVQIDTQAREGATTYPSSPGQRALAELLAKELRHIGAQAVVVTEHSLVYATIPATSKKNTPAIGWVAHVDTSPESSGQNVKPIIHRDYQGGDLVLPGDPRQVIRVAENPELQNYIGGTIVTSDGTTLLGADDKAGVAVIMDAAAHLLQHPEIPHGPIRICFTCDEEIGHGVDHVKLEEFNVTVAYTLDGMGQGELENETFSADKATVTIHGVNIHPSIAKGRMTNAIRLAAAFISRLPHDRMSPETTSDREGFIHPVTIEGGVPAVTIRLLLRDFATAQLAQQAKLLNDIAADLMKQYPAARIEVNIEKQYRNMADGMVQEPRAVAYALEAIQRAGLKPKLGSIRGGTDGSRLTEMGLPTPNLSTGEHNPHSPLEWTTLEDLEAAKRVLIELVQVWHEHA